MKRSYTIALLYLIWLVGLFAILIAIPAYAQRTLPLVSNNDTPQPAYELEKSSNKTTWCEAFSLATTFDIPFGKPIGYQVEASLDFYVDMVSHAWRNTMVTYSFLCNDDEVRVIVEHIDGTNLRFGGSYPKESIDNKALKDGENELKVNVTISSQSEASGGSSFLLRIERIKIDVISIDFDGDTILDYIDPLLGINNFHIMPIIMGLSLPVFVAFERRFKSTKQ